MSLLLPAHRPSALRPWVFFTLLLVGVAAQAADEPMVDLRFGSFFRQPVGARGLEISDALQAVSGRRVRLVGYMVGQEVPVPGGFLFTPLPVRMSEHADGEADDLPPSTVTVLLDPAQSGRIVLHQSGRLMLTGRLEVGRSADSTGRVSWVRLWLDPDALAERPLAAPVPSRDPSHTP